MRIRTVTALLALLTLLVGCSRAPSEQEIQVAVQTALAATAIAQPTVPPTPDACSPAGLTSYGTAMKTQLDLYYSQLEIAQSTPRVSLGAVLQGLFTSEQAVNAVIAPPCLADWAGRTKNMMALYRTSLNQFAAQKETESASPMIDATAIRNTIDRGLVEIVEGKVPVLPK